MQFAGFRAISFIYAPGLPECQRIVITSTGAAAATLSCGDAVYIVADTDEAGIDAADAITDKIYGYLEGFVTPKGLPLELAKSSDYDGTFTASPGGDTYVGSTTNAAAAGKKIAGIVRPAFGVKVSALLSAAKGTTAGSNFVGIYFSVLTTDSRKLDETTATATAEQFLSLPGRSASDPTDPSDPTTTRIIAEANETQLGVT